MQYHPYLLYCFLAVAAFIIRTAISVKQEYSEAVYHPSFETIEERQGDGTVAGVFLCF